MSVIIEDFGGRVATIWSQLRSTTRQLVERALQSAQTQSPSPGRNAPYDARADLELSKLLEARQQLSNLITYMDGKAGAEELISKVLNDPALLKSLADKPAPTDAGEAK